MTMIRTSPCLTRVVERGTVEAVREAVAATPSGPNQVVGGLPLLCLAARHGKAPIVELLLQLGADPSAGTSFRETSLHLAAEHGHVDACRVLLRHPQCDLNAQDAIGRTPLFLAAFRGHLPVCELLLDAHADWRVQDGEGRTVFTAAATVSLGLSHCENILHNFQLLVRKEEEARMVGLARLLCQPPCSLPALPASLILRECRVPKHLASFDVFMQNDQIDKAVEAAVM
eukprot:CAMPEP_0170745452 /NCGR_PEP_ID=MMETSP0437-20130122/8300_1 /TAXON_ID=0 /ORGANISM="Sexangularia sp." /LENGTH=228 /DNA_ID=CAMNT_0011084171 /DNA_START=149 /DNA_END=835 /DNA_ORIENTATION=-